jgi:hypothetical protein
MTDHVVQMRASFDDGRNWSQWRNYNLGGTGDFTGTATFRRLGLARKVVVEFKDTSAFNADVVAASIDLE